MTIKTNKNIMRERRNLIIVTAAVIVVTWLIFQSIYDYNIERKRIMNETIISAFQNGTIYGQASVVNVIIGNKVYPLNYIRVGNQTEVNWVDKNELCDG